MHTAIRDEIYGERAMTGLPRSLIALSVTANIAGAAFAASHTEQNPAVTARTAHMGLYSFSLGTLGAMVKGETEYDAETAQAAADRLVALSGMDQAGYWPPGTSSDEVESRALPALFENRDDYDALTRDLNEASMAMADVAGDGVEAIGGQMKSVGDACGACHEEYRKPED